MTVSGEGGEVQWEELQGAPGASADGDFHYPNYVTVSQVHAYVKMCQIEHCKCVQLYQLYLSKAVFFFF